MSAPTRWIQRIVDLAVAHKAVVFVTIALGCSVGFWCMQTMPVDAVPDLGDTQVIIYSKWDRSPDLIESQVTYPIVTAMLGTPHVKTVRGITDFGYSFVYVIFDDTVDLYWARSRTMEYLSGVQTRLPDGVKTEMGPDATSLGWVYQYALVDSTGKASLADLRSYQDWYLRNSLRAVPGVADVATLGGYKRQYQVNVDPSRLRAYGLDISQVVAAVRQGNVETSGRLLEFGGTEYMIRGRGYATSLEDFREIVVASPRDGNPIRVRDLGEVVLGPELRRGVAELDGRGETVSGIVLMRSGESPVKVIDAVKAKLRETESSLPPGVKVVPIYDRSELIHRTIGNVKMTIAEIVLTVAVMILIFLWHFPSAVIPLVTMPVAVLLSFIPLRLLGVSANLMSLAGVALAFGELIDASIIVVEQSHKRLEEWERKGRPGSQSAVVLGAVQEVAGPIVFSLLIIAVSVIPVFALEAEEGRMFRPLAYTKGLAMLVAAILAVTLDPALRLLLTRTHSFTFRPAWLRDWLNRLMTRPFAREEDHPISGPLMRLYEPVAAWTLRWRWLVLSAAVALVVVTVPVFTSLGSEFLPSMDEGSILYMPTTMPGVSVTQAQRLLSVTDGILKQFPEVDRVLGKAGRADTPTDPAPLSMLETLITLKPRSQWRRVDTWYSSWAPEWTRPALRQITSDTISSDELLREMDTAVRAPGVSNGWTTPIRGRIDMLSSGMRTPVGLRITGRDADAIEKTGEQVQTLLRSVRGTRNVIAERTNLGYFIDIKWRRDQLARYGISMAQAQQVVDSAIGGDEVTTLVQGAERYSVSVRYQRDFRSDLQALGAVLVSTGAQRQTPISELAELKVTHGPSMIRDENGLLTGYVYVDLDNRDPGSYVAEASRMLTEKMTLAPGTTLAWGGQYEAMSRANKRLKFAIPITLALVVLLIYFSTGSLAKTALVTLSVPFAAVGAVWYLHFLDYKMSVAVWIGLIGLVGIVVEMGVFMVMYLDLAYEEARWQGQLRTLAGLREAIVYGAAKRLRPKLMTFATACLGLLPIMWSTGPGSGMMKRIAAPMVGGMFSSFALELLVFPVIYEVWRRRSLRLSAMEDTGEVSLPEQPVFSGASSERL